MSNRKKLKDYSEYFIPTDEGVLVNTEIFEHRKTLGGKIWALLKLFTGSGNERDIQDFERTIDDNYLARKEFDAIRGNLFEAVAKRDGRFCKKCGTKKDLTLDHITPLSRGGPNTIENMQILCRYHNSQKGVR